MSRSSARSGVEKTCHYQRRWFFKAGLNREAGYAAVIAQFLLGCNCRSKVSLDDVIESRCTFSSVGSVQICHIKCRSAYILYHID